MLNTLFEVLGLIAMCFLFTSTLVYTDYKEAKKEHKGFLEVLFNEDE